MKEPPKLPPKFQDAFLRAAIKLELKHAADMQEAAVLDARHLPQKSEYGPGIRELATRAWAEDVYFAYCEQVVKACRARELTLSDANSFARDAFAPIYASRMGGELTDWARADFSREINPDRWNRHLSELGAIPEQADEPTTEPIATAAPTLEAKPTGELKSDEAAPKAEEAVASKKAGRSTMEPKGDVPAGEAILGGVKSRLVIDAQHEYYLGLFDLVLQSSSLEKWLLEPEAKGISKTLATDYRAGRFTSVVKGKRRQNIGAESPSRTKIETAILKSAKKRRLVTE